MEAKHTPGPWVIADGGPIIADSQNMIAVTLDMFDSNEDLSTWIQTRVTRPEREANARLIAAAPELLEALEELVTALDYAVTRRSRARRDAAVKSARAAIAKARGEG